MSADSRINIVLDVDTQGTEQIEATSARLAALGRSERSLGQETNRLSGRMDELTGRMNSASGAMGKLNKANNLFIAHARKIMYLVIGLGIEFLAVTASLVSVNAAFAVGNAAVKLYNWGMQGLAGAVAAAGVAAITAAAAFTEFNAAAQAFRFKDGPGLGSAISQSADALRMLQVNSTLATYGITALNQAYVAFSKNAKLDPKAVKQLEMMADFGTGGNREKSMAASAEYISLLKKNKGFSSETTQLAKQIGPEFEKAAKKYGSASSLLKALESGKLAKDAGVEGFGKTVNQTLMAQLKGYLTKAFVELSDAGRYLLEPVKKAFNSIFGGLTNAFRMVRGDLIRFGRGGLLDSLETLSKKTETFAVKLFREFLPAAAGWWKRTGDFFKAFVNEFNQARRSLDSMREGGSVVIDTFGKPLVQIFKRIGSGAREFAQIAKENKPQFSEFGDALKRIVDGFFDIGSAVRKAFTAALPIISKIATVVGQVFETLAKVLNVMAMLGPIGATMAVGAVARFAMKGTRGARYERRMAKGISGGMSSFFGGSMGSIAGNMGGGGGGGMVGSSSVSAASAVVNAGTVVVNGKSVGGGGGGGGRGSRGGRSLGDRSYGSSAFMSTDSYAPGSKQGRGKGANFRGGTVQMLPTGPNGQLVPTFIMNTMPDSTRQRKVPRGAKGYIEPYQGLETSGPLYGGGGRTDPNDPRSYVPNQLLTNNGRVGGGTRSTDAGQNRGQVPIQRGTGLYNIKTKMEILKSTVGYEGSGLGLEYRGKNARVVTAARAESVERGRNLASRMKEFNSHYLNYGTQHPEDPRRPDQILSGPARLQGPRFPDGYGVSDGPGQKHGRPLTRRERLGQWAKGGWARSTDKGRKNYNDAKSLPGNSLRYLINSVRPGSVAYKGSTAQLFHGGPGGSIQGNMGSGGGGGGGGGPLPGSGAPTGSGVGNYVPTTRLRDFGSNMMTNLFGPKPTGLPGQGKNRFTNFMKGGPLLQNAAKLRGISTNLSGHMQAGGTIQDFMKNNPDLDPRDVQAAMGKDGGKKIIGKGTARMRALKMKGSAMGGGMLASVGTGMFLESGLGKKMFSDPAAQSSMQAGAMLMPFNPLLGLGVGLGGAAVNSKTTAGGAMSGAASGAAIGGMIGPWGAVIGAGIGAVVGIAFSIKNRNKMAREGAKAIGKAKLMDTVLASVAGGIKDGTSKGGRKELASYGKFVKDFKGMNKEDRASALKKAVDSGVIDSTTAELMSGQGGYGQQAVGELQRQYKQQTDILNPMFDHYDDVMRGLQLATGKSAEQLHKLAAEAGVNLYDDSLKLTDAIKGLGIGMKQTAAEINTALRDVAINATSHFDRYREGKGMEDALQSSYKNIMGGNVTTDTLIDFYQKGLDFEQLAAPDMPMENFLARYGKYANGNIFQPGGQLSGVTPTPEFTGLVNNVLDTEQKGISGQLTTNVGQALADKNIGFESTAGGKNLIQASISGLMDKAKNGDTDAINRLATLEKGLKDGTLLGNSTTPAEIGNKLAVALGITSSRGLNGTDLSEKPGAVGQTLKKLTTGTFDADAKAQLIEAHGAGAVIVRDEILAAFTTANASLSAVPEWWRDAPAWYNQAPSGLGGGGGGGVPVGTLSKINGQQVKWDGKNYIYVGGAKKGEIAGDTSTSKALRATMGAHSRFNGMLPGKRMITSSWREHSLGSPSSDHATGRAFDLTGDNLQQYAANVNGSGGFAEFHGVNGERHLHVVPPIGPIGDSSSPQDQVRRKYLVGAGSTGAGSASVGGDTFNITINETADAGATADAVVKKILSMQKQARRRS